VLGTPYLSTHPQHRSQPQSWTVCPHWPNRRRTPNRSLRSSPHASTPPQSNSGLTLTLSPAEDWPPWAPMPLTSRPACNALGPSRRTQENQGVPAVENGAPAPFADPDGTVSVFAAETAHADMPDPRTLAEAKRSHNRPPWDKSTKKPPTCKARAATQGVRSHARTRPNRRR